MTYISMTDFLMGRVKLTDLSPELIGNANTLIPKVNDLLAKFGEYRKCNSGFRTPEDQARINPKAAHSNHLICAAIDLDDPHGTLDAWCIKNIKVLEDLGLYVEDSKSTPGWTHLQIIKPKSGNRFFIP